MQVERNNNRSTSQALIAALVGISILSAALITLQLQPARARPEPVVALAFSPDLKWLAAGTSNGTVQLWQTASWRPANRLDVAEAGLNTLEFSPDSQLLAIAGRSLSLWRTSDWNEWKHLGIRGAMYGTARFDRSGSRIASVDSSERIKLWDVKTATEIRSLCCMALYGDLAFSPDGYLLAAAGHWPRVWDVAGGHEIYRLVQTRNPTFAAITFSSDGQLLATGSQDGITRIWRPSDGSQLFAAPSRRGYIETIAFQPGGNSVAYGVRNGPIWLWNLDTQTEQKIAEKSTGNVAFSADGQWLAFGTRGAVHLWKVNTCREEASLSLANPWSSIENSPRKSPR